MRDLEKQLKKLSEQANPSKDFRSELWSKSSDQYDHDHRPVRMPLFQMRFATVAFAVVLLVFGTGTGVYAYQSPDVVEGHVLHPIKQGIEGLEGRVAVTSERRARFHRRMLERRLREAERLERRHPARVAPLLEKASEQLEGVVTEIEGPVFSPETRKKLLKQLKKDRIRYESVIERVYVSDNEDEVATDQEIRELPALNDVVPALEELHRRLEASELTEEEKADIIPIRVPVRERNIDRVSPGVTDVPPEVIDAVRKERRERIRELIQESQTSTLDR